VKSSAKRSVTGRATRRKRAGTRSLHLERLEDRILLSAGVEDWLLGPDAGAVDVLPDTGQDDPVLQIASKSAEVETSGLLFGTQPLQKHSAQTALPFGPLAPLPGFQPSIGRSPSSGAVFIPDYDQITDYDWWYGCSPTAAGMHAQWWSDSLAAQGLDVFPGDPTAFRYVQEPNFNPNNFDVPGTANGVVAGWEHHQSGQAAGNTHGYWEGHVPDSLADWFLTDDGGSYQDEIEWGMKNFMAWDDPRTPENESIRVTTHQHWSPAYEGNWNFDQYKAIIDGGEPVHLWLYSASGGHSVLGVGYNDGPGSNNWIELYTTWHQGVQEWEWTNETQSGYGFTCQGALEMTVASLPSDDLTGYVALQHAWMGDLDIHVGLGDPGSPLWETRVWRDRNSSDSNFAVTDVDLSGAWDYLGTSQDWYVRVLDDWATDSGTLMDFQVRYQGDRWFTDDAGTPLPDMSTTYAYVTTDIPLEGAYVESHTPSGTVTDPQTSFMFQFRDPMNESSFTIEDDVASFTGPAGADLLSEIVDFSWPDAFTLEITLNEQSAAGRYEMVIGPQIRNEDGDPMNQDEDASTGEPTEDQYVAEFWIAPSVTVDLQSTSDSGASDTDRVTDVTLPTYDVTVNGPGTIEVDWDGDGEADETDDVDAAGTYSYSPPSEWSDGVYPVDVTFTDTASNVGTDGDPTTIDTQGPTVSNVTPAGEVDYTTDEIEVVFSDANPMWEGRVTNVGNYQLVRSGGDGTFGDGNEVDVSSWINAVAYTPGTKAARLLLADDMLDEAYQLTVLGSATIRDAAGNPLNDGADEVALFSISASLPNVSVQIQAGSDTGESSADHVTNDTTPRYDVTVDEAGTVEIDWDGDGTPDQSQSLGGAGTYEFTPAAAWGPGVYPVNVTFTDVASNVATDSARTTVDTAAPTVSGVTPSGEEAFPVEEIEVVFDDDGAMWQATATDSGNYVLIASGGDGTFDDGNEADLADRIDSVTYEAGTGAATLQLSNALMDEYYRLTILGSSTIRDSAGNPLNGGADGNAFFTVDTADPVIILTLQEASDTGVSSADHVTYDDTPTYGFEVNKAGTIQVDWKNDGTLVDTHVVDSYGTYWYAPSAALGDDTHTVVATFTDLVSNVATDNDQVTVDTSPPAAPGAPVLQAGADTGLFNDDDVTGSAAPVFDLASTDDYFRFYRDGAQISGDYESGPTYVAAGQAEGTWGYALRAYDAAGNASADSGILAVTIDRTAPDAPDVPDLRSGDDSGMSSTDNLTSEPAPTLDLSGFGTYWRLDREGVQVSGDYETAAAFTDGPLADGDYAYVLYAADVAGNLSAGSTALGVTVDTLGPTVPTVTPSGEVDAPVDEIEVVFADANALWAGTVTDPANYVLIVSGGDAAFGDPGDVDISDRIDSITYDSGTGTATLFFASPLEEEAYRLTVLGTVTVMDEAGNPLNDGADEVRTFTVDGQDPSVAAVLQTSSDTGVSDSDRVTRDATPTYDVTVNEPGTLEIDWENDGTVDVADTLGAAGTYPYTPASVLGDAVYPVAATFTDTAGNEAADTDPTTIDTAAPSAPGAPDLQPASDSGMSDDDDFTNATNPAFDVASTDDYFRFYRDGTQVSGDYEADNSYTETADADGTYDYTLVSVDAAGNESAPSDPLSVTVAATPPAAPPAPDLQAASDTGNPENNVTADRTPAFDVVVPGGLYFRLYRDGQPVSAAPILGQDGGVYRQGTSEQLAQQPLGRFEYTATLLDAAGNESDASEPLEVQITSMWPLGYHEYADGVVVTLYDVNEANGLSDPVVAWSRAEYERGVTDVLVNPGRIGDGLIASVELYGNGAETGDLGIMVENGNGLAKYVDRRTGTPPLAFLVAEGGLRKADFTKGLAGMDLNGFTSEGGLAVPEDIDGDGDTDDVTGLWVAGDAGRLRVTPDVTGEIVIDGDLARLDSRGELVANVSVGGDLAYLKAVNKGGTAITGDIDVAGHVGKLYTVGDVAGNVSAGDGLGRMQVASDLLGDLTVEGDLGRLTVKGDVRGTVTTLASATEAGDVGKIEVKGGRIVDSDGDPGTPAINVAGDVARFKVSGYRGGEPNVIVGDVAVRGLLKNFYVTGGDFDGALTAGAMDKVVYNTTNGVISDIRTVTRDGQDGHLASLKVRGGIAGRVKALGWIGSIDSRGDVTGQIIARQGLDSLSIRSTLSGTVEVTHGDLGRVTVKNKGGVAIDGASINVARGGLGRLALAGDVLNADISVLSGDLGDVNVRGDFTQSSIQAQTLSRVRVSGHVSGTDGDDVIQALYGKCQFEVTQGDARRAEDISQKHNHADFDGVDAYVGRS